MKIIPEPGSERGIIRLAGEIDLCSVPELRNALELMAELHRPMLLIDLSGVTFLDSSGLSILIDYWRRTQENGSKFVVVGAAGEVLEIFRLTNLDQFIPLFATEREACSALDLVA
ncbi:MAG: anti-sigma factor antagonist [Verrucomicrobiaceae bacterium]|nr:MAG: anti-sigma factor antagonist [Verrucomicrobiaceae bacterium]